MKAYLKGFYRGSKPRSHSATKCSNEIDDDGPVPVEGWQKGWACFILTRILNGTAGDGEVPMEFDFTEKK